MKQFTKITAAIMLAFIPFISHAQYKYTEETPHIEVRVSAERKVVPNEIYLDINIHEDDYRKKSINELEKTLYKVIEDIDMNLLADLQVADLTSNFKDYFIRKSQAKVNKSYVLKVKDAKTAGLIISELQEEGISEINLSRTDISNKEEIMDELRVEAMQKAKARASLMAESIGQRITKAYKINESSYYPQRFNSQRIFSKSASSMETDAVGGSLDLEFEKSKLEVTVTVRFLLF